jgi:hypothetical protein
VETGWAEPITGREAAMTTHPTRSVVRRGSDRSRPLHAAVGNRLLRGWGWRLGGLAVGAAVYLFGPLVWADLPGCTSSRAKRSMTKIVRKALARTGQPNTQIRITGMRAAADAGKGRTCRAAVQLGSSAPVPVVYRIVWESRLARRYRLTMRRASR